MKVMVQRFAAGLLAASATLAVIPTAAAFDSMIYLDAASQYAGTAAVNSAIDEQRKKIEAEQAQRGASAQAQRSLTPRQARCAARYRSYNPETDSYFVRPGVPKKCPF